MMDGTDELPAAFRPLRRSDNAKKRAAGADNLEQFIMKAVKTYSTRVDADLAKIALEAAGVPSAVVGVGVDMEGGTAGVQLLVPDEYVEAALRVLERS